jgi:hypothetical protein
LIGGQVAAATLLLTKSAVEIVLLSISQEQSIKTFGLGAGVLTLLIMTIVLQVTRCILLNF